MVKLHTKILNDGVQQAEFLQAARILGILDSQQRVVIESEYDQEALCDFNIYEEIREGKSTLSRFAASYSPENRLETELLTAMLQSEASLYEVVQIDKQERTLLLHDILSETERAVKLLDLSLSGSVDSKVLFNRRRKIIKKLGIGIPSADSFIAYFHLNRSDGIASRFEDVR